MSESRSTAGQAGDPGAGSRRGRSARYPGIPLGEAIGFCERIDGKGLDGLPAGAIAEGLGYSNVRTNTFSAGLSSARQFGLLSLEGDRYTLTPLARSILHPVEPSSRAGLLRRAFLEPPLYASLAGRYAGRRLPDAAALANALYHHEHITASAKQTAAEAFLGSARFAGVLDADGVFRIGESAGAGASPGPHRADDESPAPVQEAGYRPRRVEPEGGVRVELRLWGADAGKLVRIRAPESMTASSFDRLVAALRLHIRVEQDEADMDASGA